MKNTKIVLLVVTALITAVCFYSCNRLDGTESDNAAPEVRFINTPFDSTGFNYAPIVYWIGYDSDGLISGYEYFDDSSQAGREAYRAGDAALLAYINSLSPETWIQTARTEETVFLGTVEGEIKEHVFILRSIDNKGARSGPKVHTFFRTNLAPFPPELKWAQGRPDYNNDYPVADTLFWGDTITTTYPGMEFLWKGADPDSRELNVIPLEFSYALVRIRDANGDEVRDTVPYPIYNDSSRVIGYGQGWSPWTGLTSAIFFGQETGQFEFTLRVRDDGLTMCHPDSFGHSTFYAIKPTFSKQLLIINENSACTAPERANFGCCEADSIMAFYERMLPEAYSIAELLRAAVYDSLIPEPLEYRFGDNVQIFNGTQDCQSTGTYPYQLMGQFKWIWWISDDNCNNSDFTGTTARLTALSRYLDVGGSMIMSGRRFFNSSYAISGCPASANDRLDFFERYFNINGVCASTTRNLADGADFVGASTGDQFLPDFSIDTMKVCSLRWASRRVCALPGIEYVSRAISQNSFDFSATLYTYESNTVDASYDTTNVDCIVHASTPSRAELRALPGHTTIFSVNRVYNRTKGVFGQFQYLNQAVVQGRNTAIIVCSTPSEAGQWLTTDTLEVDYTFSPVSESHNRPVGVFFQKHSTVQELNQFTGEFSFSLQVRYRTALYTYPISFMDDTPIQVFGFPFPINPVAFMIANHIIQFNSPRDLGNFDIDF